jgi:ABC-type glycerol-3-phosphate transport system substrate-binding protein
VYVWAGFLRAFGGDWQTNGAVKVNTPQAVQATEFWSKLLQDYGPPGAADYDWQQNRIEFDQGKAAMTIDATANGPYNEQSQYSSVVGKVGYAPIPNAVASPSSSNHSLEVHALYLSSASHNKDAAWKFMSWATSPTVQQQELTLAPQPGLTATSVLHSAQYNKLYGAFVNVMLSQLATGNPNYLPTGAASNTIINATGTALSQTLSGGASAQSALDNAQNQINQGG